MNRKDRTRSVAYVGMTVALLTVSSWIALPLGPVPFTLQTFVLAFALLVLRPTECLAALGAYLALGAVGVPVFSGMRGGIGMLAGPTGGFLWGFVVGAMLALVLNEKKGSGAFFSLPGKRSGIAHDYAVCLVFLIASYLCGWVQLIAVTGMGPVPALLTAIVPFIIPDLAKLAIAVAVARSVKQALPSLS